MPKNFDDCPTGDQVHEYLDAYVDLHDLSTVVHLSHEVVLAQPTSSGWQVVTRNLLTDVETNTHVDHFVICNGVFSDAFIPTYLGIQDFEAAGGSILHTQQVTSASVTKDKDVVVVGYGKSACDIAVALAQEARSVTLVARSTIWKLPKHINALFGLKYSWLFLTRMGESLFEYIRPWPMQKVTHSVIGKSIRDFAVGGLGTMISHQLGFAKNGLLPPGPFDTIADSTVSLVTDGFYEAVDDGSISVRNDMIIERLEPNKVLLADKSEIPASLIVCGTGFHQRASFLPQYISSKLVDSNGDWLLYRNILPVDVPNLSFNGYNASLFSTLTSEIGALWIAAYLDGALALPSRSKQRIIVEEQLEWSRNRTNGKHGHGTVLVPFSLGYVDDLMRDMKLRIGRTDELLQWFAPVDPLAYAGLSAELKRRLKIDAL